MTCGGYKFYNYKYFDNFLLLISTKYILYAFWKFLQFANEKKNEFRSPRRINQISICAAAAHFAVINYKNRFFSLKSTCLCSFSFFFQSATQQSQHSIFILESTINRLHVAEHTLPIWLGILHLEMKDVFSLSAIKCAMLISPCHQHRGEDKFRLFLCL